MKQIYKIEPILEERIWGGQKIREHFHYETKLQNIAQAYHVIAIPGHLDCRVCDTNMTLSEFYNKNRELFDCDKEELPVRLVTGCANGRLSVHLHPRDEYALLHEKMRGKVEGCTMIPLDDEENLCEMILGHNANSIEEFTDLADKGDWDHLLRTISFHSSDFLYYPYNCIHGEIGDGNHIAVAYSTNGDVSYRLYDYDRNDPNRPLHKKEVLENVNIPDLEGGIVNYQSEMLNGCMIYHYFELPGEFTAKRIKVCREGTFNYTAFQFLLCGNGSGYIDDVAITAGDTVFVPANYGEIKISGAVDLYMISYTKIE